MLSLKHTAGGTNKKRVFRQLRSGITFSRQQGEPLTAFGRTLRTSRMDLNDNTRQVVVEYMNKKHRLEES